MNNQPKKAPSVEEVKEILRKNGFKATPQRLAVHQAMLKLGHASVDAVCDELPSICNTKITTASIYNVLSQMAAIGIYQRRMSANNKMYFDVNTFKHFHLYDTENNEYKDVIDDELNQIIEERLANRRFRGYKVDCVDVQIICHPTRKRI
ncbi:MAG: transcriptional repressor [Bacteroidales bacterium]|nr:transcriptional repressor [Bacteroidales bacterium]